MAKKRPSLKDKDVFKRSKELDALFGSPTQAEEESVTEETTPQVTETPPPDAPAAPAAAEEAAGAPPGGDEPPTPATDLVAQDAASFPPATAAEGAPDISADLATLVEDLPAGDTVAAPPGAPPVEDLPVGEIGEFTPGVDDRLDFPAALEAPPGGPPVEDLPAGEAGDIVPDVDETLDFPAALETPPPGETGAPPEADVADIDLLDSALAEEPLPVSLADSADGQAAAPVTTRPVPPPSSPPPSFQPGAPYASVSPAPAAAAQPPTTATGAPVVSRTTRLSLAGDDMVDDTFDFSSIGAETPDIPFELPQELIESLTPEERKKRTIHLKDPRIREQFLQVYNAIDTEYEHILKSDVSVSKSITDWSHRLLGETRHIIMNYQIEFLDKAEWNIEQVRARLDRAEESSRQGGKWSLWITLWGIVWFLLFVYLIFKPDYLQKILASQTALSDLLVPDVFLRTIFFGGIGGVAAVFYSLLRYVSERRFDKAFVLSYFTKPFMGMIVASLIYLIVFVVMRPFNITPNIDFNGGDETSRFVFEVLSYILAAAAGFKENLFFDLLSKVMKILFRDTDTTQEVEAPHPPPGPFTATS
ncbi:MAG: hypothetical protein ACE5G8_07835 [Anaerolineae bacterium]